MIIKQCTMAMAVLIAALPLVAKATPPALTQVATINGCYDCLYFDTPALQFNNITGGMLTNAQMVLTGYQGDNNGITQTVSLGTLGSGLTNYIWSGSTTPGNLSAYDYDDEFVGTSNAIPNTDCSGGGNTNTGGCVPGGGTQWYAQTGNFSVTFTATVSGGTYNGQSVYSVFTPASNATGGFVSWEGLNAAGYSEQPCCDIHSGGLTNDLANIYLGTPPPPPPPSVPEPASWALAALGLGLVGVAMRRRARASH